MILVVFEASLLVSIVGVVLLIPRLHWAGITGQDMHKPGKPRGAGDRRAGVVVVVRSFRDNLGGASVTA